MPEVLWWISFVFTPQAAGVWCGGDQPAEISRDDARVRSCPAAKPERRAGGEPWPEAVRAARVLKASSLVSCAGRHGRGRANPWVRWGSEEGARDAGIQAALMVGWALLVVGLVWASFTAAVCWL